MIDKRLLRDTVTVKRVERKDEFGDYTHVDPITVKYCRFDRQVSVSGTDNSVSRTKTGTIFVYPAISKVIVGDDWLNATVSDNEREYTVKSIQYNYLDDKVFSCEIEVV